ncbi:unnamed protein product [Mycena citricolor]|uniref:Uncharacterized protein n=1 Tax=Mycena citricolor TaxID=2018698 RepID=A0AAD2HKC2_9AGAR|nr:unnamed protein product [Mycena citricolor]
MEAGGLPHPILSSSSDFLHTPSQRGDIPSLLSGSRRDGLCVIHWGRKHGMGVRIIRRCCLACFFRLSMGSNEHGVGFFSPWSFPP